MKTKEVNGTYGSQETACTVLVCENRRDGSSWYCIEGSVNVNLTFDEISEGVDIEQLNDVDIEQLNDVDMFTSSSAITTVEDLESAIQF